MIADAWAWHQAHPDGYGGLKQRLERRDAVGQHRARRLRGVDHGEALRLGGGELVVGGARSRRRTPAPRARAGRRPRRARRRARAPSPGRSAAAACGRARSPPVREQVERADLLDAEPAPRALVGERGVDEAVEQHPVSPAAEQRPQLLRDELRARRGVEQRLGARVDVQRRVLDQRADALGERDAARLAQQRPRRPRSRSAPRAATSVVLPAPSMPSSVMSRPRTLTRRPTRVATVASCAVALAALEPHPHAAAVLGAGRRRARPRTPTCCTARPGAASAPPRAPSPPSCSPTAPPTPPAPACACEHGAHPDLTWVAPSGAHEMLPRRRRRARRRRRRPHAVRGRLPRVRHRARRHDERPGRQRAAQDARGAARLRASCCCSPTARARCCRRSPRAASPCASTRRRPAELAARLAARGAAPAAGRRPPRGSALGDGERALALAVGDGAALRAHAEAFARAPLHGKPGASAVARCSSVARARGAAARAAYEARLAEELAVPAQEGAQAARDRARRGGPPRRAPRAHRRARPRPAARRPVVPRPALRRRRRARARPPRRPRGRARRRRRGPLPRRPARGRRARRRLPRPAEGQRHARSSPARRSASSCSALSAPARAPAPRTP